MRAILCLLTVACAHAPPPPPDPELATVCREDVSPFEDIQSRLDACFRPEHALLDVSIRVRFDFSQLPGASAEERARLAAYVRAEAAAFWSRKHRLMLPTGLGFRIVDIELRLIEVKRHAQTVITIAPAGSRSHVRGNWSGSRAVLGLTSDPAEDRRIIAHEVGHLLGLDDEYVEPQGGRLRRYQYMMERYVGPLKPRNDDARIMSIGWRLYPEHGAPFAALLTRVTGKSGIRVLPYPPIGPIQVADVAPR